MQYRQFGKLDFNPSALGFGCMRLPTRDGKIDRPEAAKMLHYAIERGVNYLDTAYPYHNGESESFVGEFLAGGYRNRVKLATKMPVWQVNTAADFDKLLDEQLRKLRTETLDFYLLHALDKESWRKIQSLGVLEWAEKAMAAGRFEYLGFSFHDDFAGFKEIIDAYDRWTMCQIQYNYIDIANRECLQYAAAQDIAVVIMEPLLGGSLVNPPAPIQAVWDAAPRQRSAVAWGLQWLWDQPEVSLVLSGMSTMEQVEENLAAADESGNGILSDQEQALFNQVRELYQTLRVIPCTRCEYCLPCPNGVAIPRNFGIYNLGFMYDKPAKARGEYDWLIQSFRLGIADHDERAAVCTGCGVCATKCPQNIPIPAWLKVIHEVLGEGKEFRKAL